MHLKTGKKMYGMTANSSIDCPKFLTYSGYSESDDRYFCDFTDWAYGIFALLGLLAIMAPVLLIICCIVRRKNNKRLRRLTSSDHSDYMSSTLPYQPLKQDNRQAKYNYGAVEHSERTESPPLSRTNSPIENSAEPSLTKQDSTSIASSKASMFPNFDEASLCTRNAVASRPRAPTPNQSQRGPEKRAVNKECKSPTPYLVTDFSTNVDSNLMSPDPLANTDVSFKPAKKFTKDQQNVLPSEVPIYAQLEDPEERQPMLQPQPQTGGEPIYNVLEKPKQTTGGEPIYNVLEKPKQTTGGEPIYNVLENPQQATEKEPIYNVLENPQQATEEEPIYNVLEDPFDVPQPHCDKESLNDESSQPSDEKNLSKPESEQCSSEEESTAPNEPFYQTLEPPVPESPEKVLDPTQSSKQSFQKDDLLLEDNPKEDLNPEGYSSQTNIPTKPEEGVYMPLIPPKTRKLSTDDSKPLPQPRKRFESRADYEELLSAHVQALPINERNGQYILRDSVTSPGSKVLTMYCKKQDNDKEIYNFKICFDGENQAHLVKSKKRFPSITHLLDYLRENKDMLPCTLRSSTLEE
ncbi:predicted protein [Nematostella vectensis]|uniref:SH2 domain-containing protein n=1 Tax=Nematostella vectensis TaxID=45351 RepID=A7S653_NEMVE|nr:proteoglycan 4 [Nematostella vectensis]EDO40798.1 predicted protein [Nematostella vectensis]|eukprot:XP_001632861.1 predicted protein [Nematostella vectensis]